jgi:hypothetical protein
MLDQNTTTVLTALITGTFTLGAATIVTILNNRHSATQEKEKTKQEEAKHKREVIEEIYQTLLRIEDMCQQLAYDARNTNNFKLDIVGAIKQIRSTSQRISVLIRLYLPLLKGIFQEHSDHLSGYWSAIGALFEARKARLPQEIIGDRYTKLAEEEIAYQNSLERFRIELEKMVK